MSLSVRRIEQAEAWLADDPDDDTRRELHALLDAEDEAELADRFQGPLVFGTAGLRAPLGAGPHRMNRVVVLRAAWGIGQHLLDAVPDAATRGVVIGYDARHKSERFALDAAAVLRGLGLTVHAFDAPVPTPLVAFAAQALGAAAALVLTASHNPREYAGMKVYGPDAAQIIPPTDSAIADAIARAPRTADIAQDERAGAPLGPEMSARYLDAVAALALPVCEPQALRVAYTALHGVGQELALSALARAGFHDLHPVAAQAAPDPDFPTIAFPNPEEPAALALVLELGEERGAELVLANDPDADRLAVAARRDGRLTPLGGNEIGCLLGHHLLTRDGVDDALVLSTVVSSPMLGDIARALGAESEQTLTGHKWIHHLALAREREGKRFVFGYEEALGYAAGTAVRDKDGISAAVLVAELAAAAKRRGQTLFDLLDTLADRYGSYLSLQRAQAFEGLDGAREIKARMARARARCGAGGSLAGLPIVLVEDYAAGSLSMPPTDLLALTLAGGHRAMLRPSGTEPKLKIYVDVKRRPGEAEAPARALAEALLDALSAPDEPA